jgi:regulator of sigma E protease
MFVMPEAAVPVVVQRGSHRFTLRVQTSPDAGQTDLFGYPEQKTFVGPVNPGMPAAQGGLKQGDQVIAIDGNRDISPFSVSTAVAGSDGKPVTMTVARDGQFVNLVLHPAYGNLDGQKRWYIGAYFDAPITYHATTIGAAVQGGVRYNVMLTSAIINTVVKLVEHKAQLKQLSGPVGIAKASGQAAREGFLAFMNIMAVISLNLGILNLLPIPVLDGWHILTLGVEGTMRRDLSIAVKERAMQVGLVFLLLLILIVTYNDVLKIVVPGH